MFMESKMSVVCCSGNAFYCSCALPMTLVLFAASLAVVRGVLTLQAPEFAPVAHHGAPVVYTSRLMNFSKRLAILFYRSVESASRSFTN